MHVFLCSSPVLTLVWLHMVTDLKRLTHRHRSNADGGARGSSQGEQEVTSHSEGEQCHTPTHWGRYMDRKI